MHGRLDRVHVSDSALIGLISDTHGVMRPEALTALAGASLILHAGDIGGTGVLEHLERIAPVLAVRGNNDHGDWARRIPDARTIQVGGIRLYLIHDVKDLHGTVPPSVSVVISGHSHRPVTEWRGTALFVNPGSAGPRRFHLPVTVAHLRLGATHPTADIVDLAISPHAAPLSPPGSADHRGAHR